MLAGSPCCGCQAVPRANTSIRTYKLNYAFLRLNEICSTSQAAVRHTTVISPIICQECIRLATVASYWAF